MDFDTAHSVEILTVSTSSTPGTSVKNVVPLQIDLAKYPIFSRDERNKLRRPVRPIDRQRMRPWLMELLDLGNVFGLRWTNRHQGIFQISWRHASRLGWNLETDGDVFERWARHTGIYKEGDPPEPKRWKANFRCALHSLHDVVELTNAVERRGRNACRTYRFLQSSDEQSINRKRAKAKRAKELQEQPQKKCLKEMISLIVESGSSEDIISDTESEASYQNKVIVQKLDLKPDIPGEDFCLQHDHDYAGPDKTQKTIVLRQGVGSIVLHKEVQNPPETADEVQSLLMSNLDQLASAAVNSTGIESLQLHESDYDSTDRKTSWMKSVMNVPQTSLLDDSEVIEPNSNVKHLPINENMVSDNAVGSDKCAKKRKCLALVDESVNVNFAESESVASCLSEHTGSTLCVCQPGKIKCEGSKELSNFPSQFPLTRQRTSSPKILCRRSKRNGAKSEKSMSESTEPLMSSCLLLLEAATRLDNAEKTGKPSVPFKSSKCKQNCKIVSERHFHEFTSIGNLKHKESFIRKAKINAEESAQSSELQYGMKVSELIQTKSCSHVTSFGILRSTLENANKLASSHGDNVSKSKTVKHLLRESSNTEIIKPVHAPDTTFFTKAPGLFSGSKVQSRRPLSFSWGKPGNDIGSVRLSKKKLPICEQPYKEHESAKNGNEVELFVSDTSLFNTSNVSIVKSSSRDQQVVLKEVLPGLNASLKRTLTPRFGIVSPVVIAHTVSASGHSPQIFVSAETSSLEPAPQITSSSQECLVFDTQDIKNEFKSLPLPASSSFSLNNVMEQPFHPLQISEDMHLLDQSKKGTTLVSVLDSHNVCFNKSSGTATMKLLQSSVDPFSPALRTVTCTPASCQSAFSFSTGITPMNVLPIYSQADMSISAMSKTNGTMHSTADDENVIPLQSATVVPSSYILTNSSTISSDTSLLTVQEKGVLIFEREKKVVNDLKFQFLPVTSSSYALAKMQTEIKNTSPADVHQVDTESHSISEPLILDEAKDTCLQFSSSYPLPTICQPKMQTISILPRSCQFNSTSSVTTLKEEKPSVISSTCTAHGTVTQSDIISNDNAMTVLHCSSDVSLPNHTSIVLDFQQALEAQQMTSNEGRTSQKQDLLYSLPCNESLSVKSLAELCRRNLAHFFSILDHQTSESDENDSITESPKLELKENSVQNNCSTSEYKDIMQAVMPQEEMSCLKCGTGSQDYQDKFQHSRYVTVQTRVPDEDLPILLNSSGFKRQANNTTTSNFITMKEGLISDRMRNDLEHLSKNAESIQLSEKLEQLDVVCSETQVKVSHGATLVVNILSSTKANESQADYNCRLTMDPIAPISIGEFPVFVTSKGDSDSQSLVSD